MSTPRLLLRTPQHDNQRHTVCSGKESHKEGCEKTKTMSSTKRPKTPKGNGHHHFTTHIRSRSMRLGVEHDANYINLPLSRWVSDVREDNLARLHHFKRPINHFGSQKISDDWRYAPMESSQSRVVTRRGPARRESSSVRQVMGTYQILQCDDAPSGGSSLGVSQFL
jgi:hypothetical protein